eukprot:5241264-Alexandrium_andersonii.AAC.1
MLLLLLLLRLLRLLPKSTLGCQLGNCIAPSAAALRGSSDTSPPLRVTPNGRALKRASRPACQPPLSARGAIRGRCGRGRR